MKMDNIHFAEFGGSPPQTRGAGKSHSDLQFNGPAQDDVSCIIRRVSPDSLAEIRKNPAIVLELEKMAGAMVKTVLA